MATAQEYGGCLRYLACYTCTSRVIAWSWSPHFGTARTTSFGCPAVLQARCREVLNVVQCAMRALVRVELVLQQERAEQIGGNLRLPLVSC